MVRQSFTFWNGFGRASYDPTAMVEVGDRLVPKRISVRVRGGISEPDFAMKIEVRQGVPVCVEASLTARPNGPEVRDKDLGYLRLSDWLEQIVAECSKRYSGQHGRMEFWASPAQSDRADLASIRRVRSGRPRISQERLLKVAEIYREHVGGRPTEAVERAFGVSHRTAARYVKLARESGHLPPTTPGKKKA
jgi:hypothetical protein